MHNLTLCFNAGCYGLDISFFELLVLVSVSVLSETFLCMQIMMSFLLLLVVVVTQSSVLYSV